MRSCSRIPLASSTALEWGFSLGVAAAPCLDKPGAQDSTWSCVRVPVGPALQRVTHSTPHPVWGCNQPENFHRECREMPHSRKLPLATAW